MRVLKVKCKPMPRNGCNCNNRLADRWCNYNYSGLLWVHMVVMDTNHKFIMDQLLSTPSTLQALLSLWCTLWLDLWLGIHCVMNRTLRSLYTLYRQVFFLILLLFPLAICRSGFSVATRHIPTGKCRLHVKKKKKNNFSNHSPLWQMPPAPSPNAPTWKKWKAQRNDSMCNAVLYLMIKMINNTRLQPWQLPGGTRRLISFWKSRSNAAQQSLKMPDNHTPAAKQLEKTATILQLRWP